MALMALWASMPLTAMDKSGRIGYQKAPKKQGKALS
jgi:hypothetical protein